jgi:hypothetical protein
MTPTDSLPADPSPAEDGAEYTPRPRGRHRTSAGDRQRAAKRTLRYVFFGLAAAWGFVVGAAGILASLAYAGHEVRPEGRALMGLIPAVIVAVVGGGVFAGAYQEAKRRIG